MAPIKASLGNGTHSPVPSGNLRLVETVADVTISDCRVDVSIGNLGAEVTSRAGRDAVAIRTAAHATGRAANMVVNTICVQARGPATWGQEHAAVKRAMVRLTLTRTARVRAVGKQRSRRAAAKRVGGQARGCGTPQSVRLGCGGLPGSR